MSESTPSRRRLQTITASLLACCGVLAGVLLFGPWSSTSSPTAPIGFATPATTTAPETSLATTSTLSTLPRVVVSTTEAPLPTTATTTTTTTNPIVFDFGEIDPEAILQQQQVEAAPPKKASSGAVAPTNVPAVPPPPPGFDLGAPVGGTTQWAGTGDAADPFVLKTKFGFFAYTTNTSSAHVPVWFSADLGSWQLLVDALPTLPDWALQSATQTWAPAVTTRGGAFVLYFTTQHGSSGLQCIGAARSAEATGPFVPDSKPIVCQSELGGSIDPSVFTDSNGTAYLLWKNDGNCCATPTRIFTQPLSDDGLSLRGTATEILWATNAWEKAIIEGPSMVQVGNVFHLMYSGGKWNEGAYGIGHAACVSPVGPCYKTSTSPWQRSAGGPGGQEFFTDAKGSVWIVFHEWRHRVGYPSGFRSMYLRQVGFGAAPVTSVPVTTLPPTTLPPTTLPPTTLPPTTVPPTTVPPTTVPPTTVPPSTVPPTTVPPTTVPPTTVPPTTVPPTTVASTTAPATSNPE